MLGDEETVNRAVFQAIAISLDLFPKSNDALRMIIRSWGEHQPPQDNREANLVFYDLAPDETAGMYTERTVIDHFNAVYRFMPFQLSLVIYGPRSLSFALRVRDNMYVDGNSKPLGILRRAGIYPQPARHPPSVTYEDEDGLYRKRADLILPVWILDNSDKKESGALEAVPISDVPEVVMHRQEG